MLRPTLRLCCVFFLLFGSPYLATLIGQALGLDGLAVVGLVLVLSVLPVVGLVRLEE